MNDSSPQLHDLPGAEQYLRALPARMPEPLSLALATELAQDVDADALLVLARRAGSRWAAQLAPNFGQAQSMADLIDRLNTYWASMRWGWISLEDHRDHLLLHHHLLPIAQLYGSQSLRWTVGLVEGFYEELFRLLGADDSVEVRVASETDDGLEVQFRVTA